MTLTIHFTFDDRLLTTLTVHFTFDNRLLTILMIPFTFDNRLLTTLTIHISVYIYFTRYYCKSIYAAEQTLERKSLAFLCYL